MDGNIIRQVFLLLVGVTYITLGIYIFWKKIIASPWNEILAAAFIIYGSWRSYRAIMKK